MTSIAVENYVKAMYQLQSEGQAVTTSALAEALHVSNASATNMVKKLAAHRLVHHSPYQDVALTKSGEKLALEVIRHHRLIELFLHETLDMPWDCVHAEAEKIEHVLSEDLEDRIAAKLGDPVEDPHGDPIPTKAGTIETTALRRLADVPVGQSAIVRRVGAQAPEHLRYLGELGLKPHAKVRVLEQLPFEGPLRVRVGSGDEHILDETLARKIFVAPTTHSARGKTNRPLTRNQKS
jgi:DtxR family transcriptional regulator, Mn-dependent transcriptional regulator